MIYGKRGVVKRGVVKRGVVQLMMRKSQGFVSQRDCISYSDSFQALDEAEASHILIHFKDGAGSRKFKGLYAFVPDTNEVSRGRVGGGATMRGEGSRPFVRSCVKLTHNAVRTLVCMYVQARKVHGAGPRVVTPDKVAAFFK